MKPHFPKPTWALIGLKVWSSGRPVIGVGLGAEVKDGCVDGVWLGVADGVQAEVNAAMATTNATETLFRIPSRIPGNLPYVVSCYIHVPFCARRCGYCDFNTFQLGRAGLTPAQWLDALRGEIALAPDHGRVDTVFFGGGTPSLLGAGLLVGALEAVRDKFGLADGAEVSLEANPETVTPSLLDDLLAGGFNRLSLGMQSADPAVLAVLDRAHTPGQALRSAQWARQAGFADISLDLIYGTPGESLASWRSSVEAVLGVGPDHVSCYALIVEPGTPLARRIQSGQLPAPDDDLMADEYLLADEMLLASGFGWYELSNWAISGHACRHNLVYWQGGDWLGFGPGAHSHIGPHRWWNHKNPRVWSSAISRGQAPVAGRELIDQAMAHEERLLLELRLASGLPIDALSATEQARLPQLAKDGLLVVADGTVSLTIQGRLLADKVTIDLLDPGSGPPPGPTSRSSEAESRS